MDVKIFTYSLLAITIGVYFIPVENKVDKNIDKDLPLVVFEKPLMYTITEQNISRIVNASKAIRYKSRDEMFDADILLRNNIPSKDFKIEILKAKKIVKKTDDFILTDNVIYKRDDFISLNTNELYYNLKTRIAKNSVAYDGTYNNHYIKGDNLYLDANKNYIKSKNVHFEIDIENKK
jgi:hypothetical protein